MTRDGLLDWILRPVQIVIAYSLGTEVSQFSESEYQGKLNIRTSKSGFWVSGNQSGQTDIESYRYKIRILSVRIWKHSVMSNMSGYRSSTDFEFPNIYNMKFCASKTGYPETGVALYLYIYSQLLYWQSLVNPEKVAPQFYVLGQSYK